MTISSTAKFLSQSKTRMKVMTLRFFFYGFFVLFRFDLYSQEKTNRFSNASLLVSDEFLMSRNEETYKTSVANVETVISDLSKDKRKIEKSIKAAYEDRKDKFVEMLEEGYLIRDGAVYEYVLSVFNKIKGNTSCELFLVREDSPNAFTTGGNNIFVHLGLFRCLENESQLAFVLGHEIGHNENGHYEKKMMESINLKYNDSIQSVIKEIKESEYRQVSAMNELMIPWMLINREKSRSMEAEADVYGFETLVDNNHSCHQTMNIFNLLEQEETETDTVLNDLSEFFHLDEIDSDFSDALNVNRESSLGTFSKEEKDPLSNLLRTHPFGKDRRTASEINCQEEEDFDDSRTRDAFFNAKILAYQELIFNSLNSKSIDKTIYYCLELNKIDANNAAINLTVPFAMAFLGYQKKNRQAGKSLSRQSPKHGKSFSQLLYFLIEISPKQCFAIAENWNKSHQMESRSQNENPTMAIFDYMNGDEDMFTIRLSKEKTWKNNYFILNILSELLIE